MTKRILSFKKKGELAVDETLTDFFAGTTTSITIPSSCSSIRNNVFKYLTNLSTINIPSSVTEIAPSAFLGFGGTLNCGFAKNSINGAPWGAVEPSIIYQGGDSSSSSESSTPSIIVSGSNLSDVNGTYILTSGTHGQVDAVYTKKENGTTISELKFYVNSGTYGQWYIHILNPSSSPYWSVSGDHQNVPPWMAGFEAEEALGATTNITITEGDSSSSSSTPSLTVSGAGVEAANGTYILTSGTHGNVQNAIYTNGNFRILNSGVNTWALILNGYGMLYSSSTLTGTYMTMPDGTDPAPTVTQG